MIRILFIFSILIYSIQLFGQRINIDQNFSSLKITDQSWYYADTVLAPDIFRIQNLPENKWKRTSKKGYTSIQKVQTHWLRFKVHSEIKGSIFLSVDFTLMDSLILFQTTDQLTIKSENLGDQLDPRNRSLKYRLPTFKIDIEENTEYTLYLYAHKDKSVCVLPLILNSEEAFLEKVSKGENEMGIIYGFFLSFIAIAFLTFTYFKEWSYLWYSLYVSSLFAWLLAVFGSGHLFLWPSLTWFNAIAGYFTVLLSFIFFGLMVVSTLKIREKEKFLNRIIQGLLLFYALNFTLTSCLYFFNQGSFLASLIQFGHFTILIFPLLISYACGYIYWKYKIRKALFILLIFSISLSGMIILPLVPTGLVEKSLYELYKWLFVLECFLLLIVLLHDLFQLKIEKAILLEQVLEQKRVATENYLDGLRTERKRISQQLHDGINIRLANIKFSLSNQGNSSLAQDIDFLSKDVRRISHGLSPLALNEQGLIKALEEEIFKIESNHEELVIDFDYPDDLKNPDPTSSETIYFTLLELFQNILKHTVATFIDIKLSLNGGRYEIMVRNDGGVYNSEEGEKNGIGLYNIKSRIELLGGYIKAMPESPNIMIHQVAI